MATRWLSAKEQRSWRAFLEAIRLLEEALDAQMQRDAGMPHAYYEILVRLSEAPGRRMRMAQLATGTQSSRSRMSHAIARLEERGWVMREACADDRRGQHAMLTDAGYAALEAAAPGHVDRVRSAIIDPLTPAQLRALEEASVRIAAALADEECEAAPAASDHSRP